MMTLAAWGLILFASAATASPVGLGRRSTFTYPTFASPSAAAYRVTTSQLPLFNGIDVQDSWAGRVDPASTPGAGLFFWYFPSSQVGGSNTLSIWLNGGPGCSSLEAATQENGAFNLAPGTTNPVVNPNGWSTVSDMLYIEQPAGVGFSTGSNANLTGEVPLADAFYTFLQAFYGVFPELAAKSLFLTGESYAGFYLPYIAARILAATSEEKGSLPLSLQGLIINDGVYADNVVGEQAPTARFAAANAVTLKLNATFVDHLMNSSKACGYEDLLDAVEYPQPPGFIKLPITTDQIYSSEAVNAKCDLFDLYYQAASDANPCFNIYRITDVCPTPKDLIGDGTYLSRPDVQAALHVPNSSTWAECSNDPFVNNVDASPFTETLFPSILAQVPVLLWHGQIDSILYTAGDYVTIQNMTWNGVQGFKSAPNSTLSLNGAKAGTWHSERNLTFVAVDNAGHMIPQDQPGLALAVFHSFITSGGIGNGSLSSTSGEFIPGVLGSAPPASTMTPTAASSASGASFAAPRRTLFALLLAGTATFFF